MSKVAEVYNDMIELAREKEREVVSIVDEVNKDLYTEVERCRILGISCSFGICNECELSKGVSNEDEEK